MKFLQLFFLIFIFGLNMDIQASVIYSKAYGDSDNPAIVFIHGGPSGNATLFEGTTATVLADKGFYVIVYDRRGEGRSLDAAATFTYKEAINDLNYILDTYNLKKVNLLAHSFGGLVATLFTEQYPDKVHSLILAGALFAQQETYNHILTSTRTIANEKNDTAILRKIQSTSLLLKNAAAYRKQCYEIADYFNYFSMPFSTSFSDSLRNKYASSDFAKTNIRNQLAPIEFYKNESQTNIDVKPKLKQLKKKVKIYGIYGKQDKIFSTRQLRDLKRIVGGHHFQLVNNCSHYLFVDQQAFFITTLVNWLGKG